MTDETPQAETPAWWPLAGPPADVPTSIAVRLATFVAVARRRCDESGPQRSVAVAGGMMCR